MVALSDALLHHLHAARRTAYFQRILDCGIDAEDHLVSLLASLSTHLRAGLARNPLKAGRPPDPNRRALETDTAEMLRDRGYPVTKGRDGTLHRVFAVLLPAAGIQAGHGMDLSRSVKGAIVRMNLRQMSSSRAAVETWQVPPASSATTITS